MFTKVLDYIKNLPAISAAITSLADIFKPFVDVRVLVLLFLAGFAAFYVDAPSFMGVAGLCILVICAFGAALAIVKMTHPYIKCETLTDKAKESPMAAALIYVARTLLLIALFYSFIFWSK